MQNWNFGTINSKLPLIGIKNKLSKKIIKFQIWGLNGVICHLALPLKARNVYQFFILYVFLFEESVKWTF